MKKLTEDGPVVEAVFEVSHQDLPAKSQRVYRLLSLHPGDRFCADAARALLDPGAKPSWIRWSWRIC
ncbi:hypothetical protein [Amycolatopsis speibonae]|uniref:Uncharacterized protein n=1 Tax=Amycolatopsis speibonae TaxID=1450224 RepID=A0ABV7PE58_9PSEU